MNIIFYKLYSVLIINLNKIKNKDIVCVTIQNNTIYYARDFIIINPYSELTKKTARRSIQQRSVAIDENPC